ncbi:hypothetical protein B5C34_00080 [Pacificimonas flava]|uniref:Heme oxygenase n=1 Tax=Pacificimonas flava TaxID=1234595 RepID=A0A219B0Y7_9SPHN|nr:hypothetical protein B5C34_00080 [Pacificimonas flava]
MRRETADAHAATDERFGQLDVAKADDYALFLAAHYAATSAVEAALSALPATAGLPDYGPAAPLLAADLRHTGTAHLSATAAPPRFSERVGATYVLAGSRFGNKLIRKRLYEARHSETEGTAYIMSAQLDRQGLAVIRALSGMAGDNGCAGSAVADARLVFDLFSAAFDQGMKDLRA